MFWPMTLIFALLFSALVLTGTLDEFSPVAQFVLALSVCTSVACMAITRSYMRSGKFQILPVVWAISAIVIVGAYSFKDQGHLLALSMLEQPVAEPADPPRLNPEVMLMRAWDGHFRAVADVNDVPVGLLIDTGASLVLLRHDDARRIGMQDYELDYTMAVTTANGRSFVAPVTFEEIRIGGVVVREVERAVARPDQLHSSLLGMSFIERLTEASIRSDRIILRN